MFQTAASLLSCLRILIQPYRKNPKYSDTQKNCCNHPKIWTRWLYRRLMHPKDAARIANSVDPDQTAPLGAVWSGSTLFAQTYLSENLGSLQYILQPQTNATVNWIGYLFEWAMKNILKPRKKQPFFRMTLEKTLGSVSMKNFSWDPVKPV